MKKHKQPRLTNHRLSAVPPSPWCDVLNVREEWKCVRYQDVSSIVSRLSGQTDSQPLVIAVCFTRLPTAQHICTHIHTQINSTAYTVSHMQPTTALHTLRKGSWWCWCFVVFCMIQGVQSEFESLLDTTRQHWKLHEQSLHPLSPFLWSKR